MAIPVEVHDDLIRIYIHLLTIGLYKYIKHKPNSRKCEDFESKSHTDIKSNKKTSIQHAGMGVRRLKA